MILTLLSMLWYILLRGEGGLCINMASLDRNKTRMCRQSEPINLKPAEGNHLIDLQVFPEAVNPNPTAFRPDRPFSQSSRVARDLSLPQANQTKTNLKMPNKKEET